MNHDFFFDPQLETLSRSELEKHQRSRLTEMLEVVLEKNHFYRRKFQEAGCKEIYQVGDWQRVPFTTKAELIADAESHPPYGSNLTYPLEKYVRLHQTSGTSGKPLVVLDTIESWESWKECWGLIFRAAGITPVDRVFVAFSFGPFVGFWAAFEAGPALGLRVMTGGGQSSLQRLEAIYKHQATVLVCTPSYALHLAEVAREQEIDLSASPIRITIHAGEPGASIPSTKQRIQEIWGAKCFDHIGASEVGPYGFECHCQPGGVHINELDFICESINPSTLEPAKPGEAGELVLTSLNRWGFPVIRYRTGDLVRLGQPKPCACGREFRTLLGGILARTDDMMIIRGVNVYPSAVEAVVRGFKEVAEFEAEVFTHQGMEEMRLRVEVNTRARPHCESIQTKLQEELRNRLGLRIEVEMVAPRTLPRYELKARRFKRQGRLDSEGG
ncbi:phenylacetate--CoA ligase family protein [Acidobacteria bacterium AH-259-O06]|nr:phenylacetate--CoA ligase family protein [Acidobacteria bacterium AH-259-O06]